MDCEFCASPLGEDEPANLALLAHVRASEPCREQLEYHFANLDASWTRAMSGG